METGKDTEVKREREKGVFHVLVHSTDSYRGQGWAGSRPEVRRGPAILPFLLLSWAHS